MKNMQKINKIYFVCLNVNKISIKKKRKKEKFFQIYILYHIYILF